MERIVSDTLHSLFYDHPADRWVIFYCFELFLQVCVDGGRALLACAHGEDPDTDS